MRFRDIVLAALKERGWRRYKLAKTIEITQMVLSKMLREDPARATRATELNALMIGSALTFSLEQMQKANEMLWTLERRFRYEGDARFLQRTRATFAELLAVAMNSEGISAKEIGALSGMGEAVAWILKGESFRHVQAVRIIIALRATPNQLTFINLVLASAGYATLPGRPPTAE